MIVAAGPVVSVRPEIRRQGTHGQVAAAEAATGAYLSVHMLFHSGIGVFASFFVHVVHCCGEKLISCLVIRKSQANIGKKAFGTTDETFLLDASCLFMENIMAAAAAAAAI